MFRNTTHHHAGKCRLRSATLLTVLMLLMSAFSGFSALAAPESGEQSAERAQGTGSFLEVHVVQCPPGATGNPDELKPQCHDNGMAGVNIQVTSVDPAAGIDQAKTTQQPADPGPGIINTGTIPAGEYTVAADLPQDGTTFMVGCVYFEGETKITPNPTNASTFTVDIPQGIDVVCDLYVIPSGDAPAENAPQAETASLSIAVHACDRADLPSDDRSFETLDPNCTDLPANPITMHLAGADGTDQPKQIDAQGKVMYDNLADGTYTIYSDVDPDKAGEYLFCAYQGQDRYAKDFNADGVTTFADLSGEQITCDWFVVSAPAATATTPPPAATTPAPSATTPPTATATTPPPTATTAPAEPSATTAPAQNARQASGGGSFAIALMTCPQGYDVDAQGETADAFAANCQDATADVLFTLQASDGSQVQQTTDANGQTTFSNIADGDYTIYSNVPLEAATEYAFCTDDGGPTYERTFDDGGISPLEDMAGDQISCQWYIVPDDLRGQSNGGSVTVHLASCPQGYQGSDYFQDCHGNGIAGQDFVLDGPNGEQTMKTIQESDPGPGMAAFSSLPAGDYSLRGGPPGDFGTVKLYCTDPNTNQAVDVGGDISGYTFTLAENQDILCDWYYIPENASGQTPTPSPTQAPKKAEILVTMFACDPSTNTTGATFQTLDSGCTQTVNDVPLALGLEGGATVNGKTGDSGAGAERFFELTGGDYVLTPTLPQGYANVALFCQLNGGDVYQKSFQNLSASFTDVAGERIACSWFIQQVPQQEPNPAQPTGSITVHEMLCKGDRASIKDWERECSPGTTGTSFTLLDANGKAITSAKPNDQGILVFSALADGYYGLKQETGVWCKAAAERVDGQSRVIVRNGTTTNVFLYQCNQDVGLPNTGSGTSSILPGDQSRWNGALFLVGGSLPILAFALWKFRRPTFVPAVARRPRDRPSNVVNRGDHRIRIR